MTETLRYEFTSKTVQDFLHLLQNAALNLEPGFQRDSVWSDSDRRKLIHSILENYPVPSVFLYKHEEHGSPVYDVLDGKQRLESIFKFMRSDGFRQDGFDVKFKFDNDDDEWWYDFKALERWGHKGRFLSYKMQVVEVSGDFTDIVELFVLINSTGKALTGAEKRNARYYKSPFLKEAQRLSRRFHSYFRSQRILRESQVARMKDIELLCELLASIVHGGLINKKTAIDRAISNEALNGNTLRRASRELVAAMTRLRNLFPDLGGTRFRNTSEFYSLVMLVWQMQKDNLILTDARRNKAARKLLERLSAGVDEVRELQRRAKGAPRSHGLYADYLLTVLSATDNLVQRKRRADLLSGIFNGLFERKDARRLFGPELRRLLWNSTEKRVCSQCRKPLTWMNFQADHIRAHSRGGLTDLSNAALICRSCNPSKGARNRARRAA